MLACSAHMREIDDSIFTDAPPFFSFFSLSKKKNTNKNKKQAHAKTGISHQGYTESFLNGRAFHALKQNWDIMGRAL